MESLSVLVTILLALNPAWRSLPPGGESSPSQSGIPSQVQEHLQNNTFSGNLPGQPGFLISDGRSRISLTQTSGAAEPEITLPSGGSLPDLRMHSEYPLEYRLSLISGVGDLPDTLLAVDKVTGEILWKFMEDEISCESLILRDGRLYLICSDCTCCLDAGTGQVIWSLQNIIPPSDNGSGDADGSDGYYPGMEENRDSSASGDTISASEVITEVYSGGWLTENLGEISETKLDDSDHGGPVQYRCGN